MNGAAVWGTLAVLTGLAWLGIGVVAGRALVARGESRVHVVARYPLRTATAVLLVPAVGFSGFGILVSTVDGSGSTAGLLFVGSAALAGCVLVQVVAHRAVSRGLGSWSWAIPAAGFVLPTIAAVVWATEPGAVAWLLAYAVACGGNGLLLALRAAPSPK
ncbi:hypothetical protein ACNI3K_02400 [Demequina sp. SO4-13]|uniref:hypothetical protein n=1 Tax=Demequina sp. SO4-13 TaxID=3401027 RepID=UPI003AF59360